MDGTKAYISEILTMFVEYIKDNYFLVAKNNDTERYPTKESLIRNFTHKKNK